MRKTDFLQLDLYDDSDYVDPLVVENGNNEKIDNGVMTVHNDMQDFGNDVTELNERIDEINNTLLNHNTRIDSLNTVLTALKEDYDETASDVEIIKQQISTHTTEIETLQNQISSHNTRIQSNAAEISALKTKTDTTNRTISNLSNEFNEFKTSTNNNITALIQDNTKNKNDISNLTTNLSTINRDVQGAINKANRNNNLGTSRLDGNNKTILLVFFDIGGLLVVRYTISYKKLVMDWSTSTILPSVNCNNYELIDGFNLSIAESMGDNYISTQIVFGYGETGIESEVRETGVDSDTTVPNLTGYRVSGTQIIGVFTN